MGIKRVIDVDFWKDDMVAEKYSAEDRYFFLYLLTNPNSKQCGIYHLPLRIMAFEMGHSKESVESIIDRFEYKFKNIIYNKETQEIAILNFLKHSIIKGGKPVEDCLTKELGKVKDKSLIAAVYKHMLPYMNESINKNEKSMYVGIKNVFLSFIDENDIKNDIENDNEYDNDNDNERIVQRIVPRIVNDDISQVEQVSEEEVMFNQFWAAYPKKVNKRGCFTSFKRIKGLKTEFPLIMEALESFKKSKDWQKENGQYIPYPQTFINKERWKDERMITRDEQLQTIDMQGWF